MQFGTSSANSGAEMPACMGRKEWGAAWPGIRCQHCNYTCIDSHARRLAGFGRGLLLDTKLDCSDLLSTLLPQSSMSDPLWKNVVRATKVGRRSGQFESGQGQHRHDYDRDSKGGL